MEKYNSHFFFFTFMLMIMLSSCSHNLFTGRRFNLDLVKVERKQVEKSSNTTAFKHLKKSDDIVYPISENHFVLNEGKLIADKRELLSKVNAKETSSFLKTTKNKISFIDSTKVKQNIAAPNIDIKEIHNDVYSKNSFLFFVLSLFFLVFRFSLWSLIIMLIFSVIAIILGIIGLKNTSNGKAYGKGLAILGLVLGTIFSVFLLTFIFI